MSDLASTKSDPAPVVDQSLSQKLALQLEEARATQEARCRTSLQEQKERHDSAVANLKRARASSAAATTAFSDRLTFPAGTEGIIINLGSHADPINPPEDPSIVVLAVEPDPATISRIKRTERRYVLAAAVAERAGLATMYRYNNGASSSLSKAARDFNEEEPRPNVDEWASPQGAPFFVPTVTLEQLLAAIPTSIDILFLKTDLQGYDLAVIKSAGPSLRRVFKVLSEASLSGVKRYVDAPPNDFNLHWEPFMRRQWGGVFEMATTNFINETQIAHTALLPIPQTKETFDALDGRLRASTHGGIHSQEGDVAFRNTKWAPKHVWGPRDKLWAFLHDCSHCNAGGRPVARSKVAAGD